MKNPRKWCAVASILAAVFLATSCGGGGGGGGVSGEDASDDLVLLDLNVADFDGVALNTILTMMFSEDLDPDSVRPETIQIRQGPMYGKQVFGNFRVDGSRVFFYPRLPVDKDLETSGFQAGTDYKVYLPSVPKVAVVRNYTADRTVREAELYFRTAEIDNPDLFIDNFLDPGPPHITSVNPVDGALEVPADATVTLTFNRRPLDPRTVSADTFKLVMLTRQGKTFDRPIAGKPLLTQTLEGVSVIFKPDFPLSDEAVYELTVSNRVEDLVGFSVPAFTSRFTIRDEAPRIGTFTLEFDEQQKDDLMDQAETTASWNELEPDALAAIFTAAGGTGKSGDLIANTDMNFTPYNTNGVDIGQDLNDGVYYDVYNFRKFYIADGATVRFQSSTAANPVIIRSIFPMDIRGTLSVTGGTGQTCLSYAYSPSGGGTARAGGAAGPGGAKGGTSYNGTVYVNANIPRVYGDDAPYGGFGGQSGESGTYNSSGTYYYSYGAGGGGGGGSRLKGDDGKQGGYPSNGYWGKGGKGGAGRTGNLERSPNVGGAGGGPGGRGFYKYASYTYFYYVTNGAGGGGGGGGVWLQCASPIEVAATGQVLAEGGTGGGTNTYYAYSGGAGGGGGGGSVKMSSTLGIDLSTGATVSAAGGKGGPANQTYYPGGQGGDGGMGFLRFEAPDSSLITGLSGANLSYTPPSIGTYAPKGGGVPSVGQTLWANLGVFDPEILAHKTLEDRVVELYNDTLVIYAQMADENPNKVGEPDLTDMDVANDSTFNTDTLSEWMPISQIQNLSGNGYQFVRFRFVFQLDANQAFDDPLPFISRFDFKFRY